MNRCRRVRGALGALVAMLLVMGCSGGGDDDAGPSPRSSPHARQRVEAVEYTETRLLSRPDVGRGPLLETLQIETDGVQMRPDFDPRILRYALYPSDTAGSLDIAAVAPQGSDLEIDGRPVRSGQTVTLDVRREAATASLRVTDPRGNSTAYELVVLPVGFPVLSASVVDPAAVADGPLYLSVNSDRRSCAPPESCWLVTADAFGVPIQVMREDRFVWDFKRQPSGDRTYQVVLAPDPPPTQSTPANAVVILERGGAAHEVTAAGYADATNGHDFLITRAGERVFVVYADREGSGEPPLIDGIVQGEDPDGQVRFDWSSEGAVPVEDSPRGGADYFHLNSVAPYPDGDLLVSARGPSQVYRIDPGTGEVAWTLGGVSGDFRFLDDPYRGFCGQHTAVPLPDDHVLLFDNGQSAEAGSRVMEREPVCPPDVEGSGRGKVSRAAEYALDLQAGTAKLVWSYEPGVYAPGQASTQRMANGNTLVGWGMNDAGLLATEVTPQGRVVFELSGVWPDGAPVTSYRALRFDS